VAKKRKVLVDVIVDDKGTTKKMAVSQRQLKGAMDGTAAAAGNTRKQIRGAAQTASAGGKQFAALASGTGGLVGAYATLAAQIFAVTAAFNFLKSAGSLKLLQEGQLAYTSAVGTSMKALTTDIQAATGAQLSFQEAAQAAAIGTAAGLNPEQITALGKAAKDTSTVLGRDLTDSFNRLVRGVTKAEPELLDELGIILRLEDAQRKYKDSLGITGELNAFQRSQAVTADVLAQVEEKYSKVLAVTGASENEFAKLGKAFDDIVNSIREFSVSFLTPIAQVLQEFPALIAAAFAPFTIQILRAALPSLAGLSQSLEKVATTAKKSYAKAQLNQKAYFKDLEKLRASPKAQLQLKKSVDDEMKANLKKVKLNKRSLLQKLRDGDELSARQLAKIKQNLDKEVRGYKIKDAKILANLKLHLKKYEMLNKASAGVVVSVWTRTGAAIGAATASGVATSKVALASLAAFGAKVGTFLAGALSILSWIGIIAAVGGLIYAFVRGEKVIEETTNKFQHLIDKEKTLSEETEKFIATQNILNDTFETGNKQLEAYGKRLGNINSGSLKSMISQQELSLAFEGFADSVQKANANITKYEKQLESLEKMAQNPQMFIGGGAYGGISAAVVNAQQTEKAQEGLKKALAESNQTFFEYIQTQEGVDEATRSGMATLARERDEYHGLTTAGERQNKVAMAYVEILDELAKGNRVDFKELFRKREAMISLSATMAALNRATAENIQKNTQLRFKQFPLTEIDAFITALIQEEQQMRAVIKTQKQGADARQKARLDDIERDRDFMVNAATAEFETKKATLVIQTQEAKLLAGKTKLLQAEVKTSAQIAKNQVKMFDAEQKIRRGRDLIAKRRTEQLELLETGTKEQQLAARLELDSLDARERGISLEENRLLHLRAQTEELQRQQNTLQQIRDTVLQSFESGVQSGLAQFIKAEKQFADAFRDMVKGVLNSVADTLAKQLTTSLMKKITGQKDPAEQMAEAIRNSTGTGAVQLRTALVTGGEHAARVIAAAVSGKAPQQGPTPPPGTATTTTGADPSGNGNGTSIVQTAAGPTSPKLFEKGYFFGRGESKGTQGGGIIGGEGAASVTGGTGKLPGIFTGFVDSLRGLFDSGSGMTFIERLGNVFAEGASGFGSLFSDLIGTIGTGGEAGSGLFGLISGLFAPARYGMKPMGYATGGIARGPQAGYPAMLHGTEAVVPLPSGGKIPVDMKGGGNPTTNNVGVTVNMSGDQGTSNVSGDPGQGEQLGRVISSAVQEELQRQRRPGGILSPYGAAGGI